MRQPVTNGRRVLGPWAGAAIVAGSMIGVGIFLVPRVVAEQVQSPIVFLLLWAASGAVALAGAVAYAELGAMLPRAGGDYVFLREAYGISVSFAAGWLLFLGVFAGSIATMSVAICNYQLPALLAPFGVSGLDRTFFEIQALHVSVTGTNLAAIGLVALLTLINTAGARPSAGIQIVTTGIPILLLALFSLVALAMGSPDSAVGPTTESVFVESPVAAITTAFLAIYFAYAGWNSVAYVGGEVDNPGRNIPRSLLAGTIAVTVLYLLLCSAFLVVLGMGGLTDAYEAGTASAVAVIGAKAELGVAALIAVALLGSVNATVLGGARIAFAMARDAALPKGLARLNPHTEVPVRALWLQAAVSVALILTGTFDQLLSLTSVAMLLLGSLTVVSLFLLRRSRPDLERPYRASGYPWLPSIYLAVSAGIIGASIWQAISSLRSESSRDPVEAMFPLIGLAVFFVVLVGHLVWTRRRPRETS